MHDTNLYAQSVKNNTLIFDGDCSFCTHCVLLLHALDKQQKITLVSNDIRNDDRLSPKKLNSVIYISEGKVFTKSDAVLQALFTLGGLNKVFYILKIIPPFIRNGIYSLIANNRYLFGNTCHVK
ncbi:MAG: DUF393 domain-containing protein [Bacteroidetes bacterium]|jgi:predicted DCC family thiol-disulfide oxidoreductase YuxK|nr:DUF393 domain-containing protein [Bacteroidota bacterium]